MHFTGYGLILPKTCHLIHFTVGCRQYTIAYDYDQDGTYWYGATIFNQTCDKVKGHQFSRRFGNQIAINRLNQCPVMTTIMVGERTGKELHKYIQTSLKKCLIVHGVKGSRQKVSRYETYNETIPVEVDTLPVEVETKRDIGVMETSTFSELTSKDTRHLTKIVVNPTVPMSMSV